MRFDVALDDILGGPSSVRVLRALYQLPGDFDVSAREVGRRAGVSHPTASKVLASLVDQGLVIVRRARGFDTYALNRAHLLAGGIGSLFDEERGAREDLLAFLAESIHRHAPAARAAYLYGSVAWGETAAGSDIDLAVFCATPVRTAVEEGMGRVADSVKARYGNRLNVLVRAWFEPALETLQKGVRGKGARLWNRILTDGIRVPLPDGEGRTRRA